jgi:tRNA/rRNA methyltransferase
MPEYSRLDRVRIVLVQTSHPGNIGAAARAMKTMGLSQLVLANPKSFPHPDAEALAAGGLDVLQHATVFESLDEALKGTTLVVASTARSRDLPHETVDCREACGRLMAQAQGGDVALVFGPERTGLTVEEVSRCQLIATIGADPSYPSLNLAQAVQVFAYELRMQAELGPPSAAETYPATYEQLESFYAQLEEALRDLRFLDDKHPGRMMRRLRRLFARARLEQEEVNILRGVLRAIRSKVE